MVRLKVCGMRPGDDLQFTEEPVVSHVGIIFVPTSKRYVPPAEAGVWLRQHGPHCSVAGVFVNSPVQAMRSAAEEAGLDTVQLHGDESPADCMELRRAGLTVWKAISVPPGATAETLNTKVRPFMSCVDGLLLDAAPPKTAHASVTGGHGVPFDWRLLPGWFATMRVDPDCPELWVAGGFTPENLNHFADACGRQQWPDGIDVSSGVERDGRKSQDRIQEMMRVVSQLGQYR